MKKSTSALIGLIMVAFALPLFAAEVSVIKVETDIKKVSTDWSRTDIYTVAVDDLGVDKKVFLHIKESGVWIDIPMSFRSPTAFGKEIWSLTRERVVPSSMSGSSSIEFVVKYQVNNKTYWDNNKGANFIVNNRDKVNGGEVALFAVNVSANPFQFGFVENEFKGTIAIKNIAPSKQVKVIYTLDHWATKKTAIATFDHMYESLEAEEWNYSLDVVGGEQVEYAISYTVNGITYWDNAYGFNYHVSLMH